MKNKQSSTLNLYEYVSKIEMTEIQKLSGDIKEMAIVRILLIELSKLFYRDTTFFINKEYLAERSKIYNKHFDLTNVNDFSIVCKSYSEIVKKLLKEIFNISAKLISYANDRYRHVDLIITTSSGKKYIVDPLMDLIEFQSGWHTEKFASKKKNSEYSKNPPQNLSFLSEEELDEIDELIGYKHIIYVDDSYNFLCDNFYNLETKLDIISKTIYQGSKIHSIADIIIYLKLLLFKVLSSSEIHDISFINSFFVDKKNLKNKVLLNFLSGSSQRKRGIVLTYRDKVYIYTYDSDRFLKFNSDEWKKMIHDNNIFIKKNYFVSLLNYMKDNGVDRNILHHSEFLRIFSRIESIAKKDKINLIEYLSITKDSVAISYKFHLVFQITKNKLRIINTKTFDEYEVNYLDEGRIIKYLKLPSQKK